MTGSLLWIIRIISLQIQFLVINFSLSFVYLPAIYGFRLLQFGKTSALAIKTHMQLLLKYSPTETIRSTSAKLKFHRRLETCLTLYGQILVFFQRLDRYFSFLFLLAMIAPIYDSQMILYTLFNTNYHQQQSIIIFLFLVYILLIDFILVFYLTYYTACFNQRLNSFHQALEQIDLKLREWNSPFRVRFEVALYYQRVVTRKPFGYSIGGIVMVTKALFAKAS